MLIPQFSLRLLLLVMVGCAVVSSLFGLALRGHGWAVGVSIAILSLGALLLAHAIVFALVWAFSLLGLEFRWRRTGAGDSPFLRAGTTVAPEKDGNRESGADVPSAPILLE